MEILHPRCAGLDVHKDIVMAGARAVVGASARYDTAEFATTTRGLLAHGLVRPSFVPPAPIQALRDLRRTRKHLVRPVGRHSLRIQKTLEDANLKLTGPISDLLGTSGRALLKALIAGETDPERLLGHTTGRLKAPRERLTDGRRGVATDPHRFMLRLPLRQIEKLRRPFRDRVERLTTIPGVSHTVAQVLVAEIGSGRRRIRCSRRGSSRTAMRTATTRDNTS